MLFNVVANIEIDGTKIIDFYDLEIKQQFNDHNEFSLKIALSEFEGEELSFSNIKTLIGKIIVISLSQGKDNQLLNEFKGIITELTLEQNDFWNTHILIQGKSPTIILEGNPNLNCFAEQDLKNIVQNVTREVASECSVKIISQVRDIKYLTQYKENNFAFLNRLSAEFGEWFFYDGKSLNFGKPSSPKEIDLSVGEDVIGIQIKLKLNPLDTKGYAYSATEQKVFVKDTVKSNDGLGAQAKIVASESEKLFTAAATVGLRPKAENDQVLGTALKTFRDAQTSKLETVVGKSTNAQVGLGCVVSVFITTKQGRNQAKDDYGKFTVTKVVHKIGDDGYYTNTFEGIPADLDVVPVENYKRPYAETQVGVVVDNADPDKYNRVKVKLIWQDKVTTDWIRVASPSAGSGGKTDKNRGFVFIPEVGDEVMVGFEYNDPDWPYVIGSVFTGKTSSGGGDKNVIKTLGTKAGHLITFDDDKKSLLIEDAKGNTISFDGKGKIILKSSDAIELQCEQSSLSMAKDGTIKLKGMKLSIEGSQEVAMKGTNVAIKGDAELKAEGVSVSVKASANVAVEGAMAKLAGSGVTEISGGIVKIN